MIEKIKTLVRAHRFTFQSERELQDQFAQMLIVGGVPFQREFILTKKDRPDFWVEHPVEIQKGPIIKPVSEFVVLGLAVEIKMGGSVRSHLRQLRRYAEHHLVEQVVLVSTRHGQADVPPTLNGKPCHCISLWQARL
jgi:hypothetical protein